MGQEGMKAITAIKGIGGDGAGMGQGWEKRQKSFRKSFVKVVSAHILKDCALL